jgi:hypothetical protein
MATFHNLGYHRDIGTLASLAAAEREYQAHSASVGRNRGATLYFPR